MDAVTASGHPGPGRRKVEGAPTHTHRRHLTTADTDWPRRASGSWARRMVLMTPSSFGPSPPLGGVAGGDLWPNPRVCCVTRVVDRYVRQVTEGRKVRWTRFAPGLGVLLSYDRVWLRGDVFAGVTVSAYLIPQVMAYAEVAGLPAITGLWACAPALVVYALLGSSRQLSVGPESTTALMTAAGVGAIAGAAGGRHAEIAALLALAVGVVCVLAWLARLGFLAELLSKPVLVGYMAGIAALMIVSQLGKITGIDVEGETFLEELWDTVTRLDELHWPTFALAMAVLAALLAFGRWAKRWPGPLIAMLAAAAVVQVFGLVDQGVAVVGEVPRGCRR